jgi:hypothetical protein
MPMSPILSLGLGTASVIASLVIAYFAATSNTVPVVGSVQGALIAIAVIGFAGCAIAGIGQATALGWTNVTIIAGSVLGVVALAVIGAGLFGWDGVVSPIAGLVPASDAIALTTERLAVVALAALIALKWVVGLVMYFAQGLIR